MNIPQAIRLAVIGLSACCMMSRPHIDLIGENLEGATPVSPTSAEQIVGHYVQKAVRHENTLILSKDGSYNMRKPGCMGLLSDEHGKWRIQDQHLSLERHRENVTTNFVKTTNVWGILKFKGEWILTPPAGGRFARRNE